MEQDEFEEATIVRSETKSSRREFLLLRLAIGGAASQRPVIWITAPNPLRYPESIMFQLFKINEGGEHYIGKVATLKEATSQILSLAEFWPAEYAILDIETGIWSSFPAYRVSEAPSPKLVTPNEGEEQLLKH